MLDLGSSNLKSEKKASNREDFSKGMNKAKPIDSNQKSASRFKTLTKSIADNEAHNQYPNSV